MDSGEGGCPGPAVLRAVEEDPSLATDSATLLPQAEVEDIALGGRRNSQGPGPATPDHVAVSLKLLKIIEMVLPCRGNPLIPTTAHNQPKSHLNFSSVFELHVVQFEHETKFFYFSLSPHLLEVS